MSGANIGFFTLLVASIVGPEGSVISFEPDPTSFSLPSKSVQRNGFSNIKLFQKCVSDTDGTPTLSPFSHTAQGTALKSREITDEVTY